MKKTCVELFAGVGGFRCGLNNVTLIDNKVEENGNWKEVECLREELSTKFIPKKITDYIQRNRIDDEIIRISKKRSYYIVELSKKTILIFDFKFNLLKRLKW